MAALNFNQDSEEPELWAAENVPVGEKRPPIHIMVQTDGETPSSECQKIVKALLSEMDDKILAAAELLLENYSYEHYKKLGVEDDHLLRDETPEGMANKAVLRALWLFDEDGDDYELWFTVPWDHEHTYDVEFENGEPIGCSVNS